jgi:hypothetical protein
VIEGVADDPRRRRGGGRDVVWQVGVLRAGASAYGRAYGFERAMDHLDAIVGPLLALGLVAAVGVRWAIGLSVIPGLLASAAIVYAIRHAPKAEIRERTPIRLRIRPVCGAGSVPCWPVSRRSRSATSPLLC